MSLDVQAGQPALEPTLLDTEPASDEANAKLCVDDAETATVQPRRAGVGYRAALCRGHAPWLRPLGHPGDEYLSDSDGHLQLTVIPSAAAASRGPIAPSGSLIIWSSKAR